MQHPPQVQQADDVRIDLNFARDQRRAGGLGNTELHRLLHRSLVYGFDLQTFRHDQAKPGALKIDDHDLVRQQAATRCMAKPQAQISHRHDAATQAEQPDHPIRQFFNRCQRGQPNDLDHPARLDGEQRFAQLEDEPGNIARHAPHS